VGGGNMDIFWKCTLHGACKSTVFTLGSAQDSAQRTPSLGQESALEVQSPLQKIRTCFLIFNPQFSLKYFALKRFKR